LHVLEHHGVGRCKLHARTELHELARSFGDPHVTGRQVESIAALEHLIVVREPIREPALEHVPPVRAGAAVAGERTRLSS
jgi:hypothetical protein